jgi:hypothetical protein
MLNSFWGKFGQKENSAQTQIINQPADLFKLVMNPAVVVGNVTILNDEGVLVSWERIEEDVLPLKTVNVVVAAYTTAMARLELYKYLEQLGERVLYYDTDSVIFVSRENDWEPPIGDFLGDLTDEMADYGPGSHITEFVNAYKFCVVRMAMIDNRIVRNPRYDVLTKHGEKSYRLQYTKRRRLVECYDTVPYGFKMQR